MEHYKLSQLLSKDEIGRLENFHSKHQQVLGMTLYELTVEDLKILYSCLTFQIVENQHQIAMVNSLIELLNREINKSGILEEYST